MRRPAEVYGVGRRGPGPAVDAIMHGEISQAAQTPDIHFGKEITTRLFSENPPMEPGMDLVALNIQRGRDHGIPCKFFLSHINHGLTLTLLDLYIKLSVNVPFGWA